MLYLTHSWVQEPLHWSHGLWTEALSALTLNRTLWISQTSACDKSPSRFSHPPRRRPEKVGDGRHTDPELLGDPFGRVHICVLHMLERKSRFRCRHHLLLRK